MDEQPEVRIEQCEKHGLRYNAAVEDGCARCRSERGDRGVGGTGFAPPKPPDLTRSLLVSVALVVAVGGGLFAAHWVAYQAGRAFFEEADGWEERFEDEGYGADDYDAEEYDAEFEKLIERDN